MNKKNDEYFMQIALKEALKAQKKNEIPVGAIIVRNNKILAKCHNKIETTKCSINHAEILAIIKASRKIKNWRLDQCTLYVTMEPCMMCCGAIMQSRIKKVVFGIENSKFGCSKYLKNIEILKNICSDECLKLTTDFFKKIR